MGDDRFWSTFACVFQHFIIIGSEVCRKVCVLESGDDFTHGGDDLTRAQHCATSSVIFNIGDDFTRAGTTLATCRYRLRIE